MCLGKHLEKLFFSAIHLLDMTDTCSWSEMIDDLCLGPAVEHLFTR